MSLLVFFSRSFSMRNWIPWERHVPGGYARSTAREVGKLTDTLGLTFLGSMLNFFRPMATCLFLCMFFLQHTKGFGVIQFKIGLIEA